MNSKRRGLGKGLDALLSTAPSKVAKAPADSATQLEPTDGMLTELAIDQLVPGKYQPRKDMSSQALEELASSIKAQGIIQPIVVRKVGEQSFEIIAGERRWRAAKQAELSTVPCLVKEVADEAAIAIALIENIQREDLNAMEEAIALQRLLNEFDLTHQEVADAVGKSRTTVSNLLRLNSLNEDVKKLLEYGDIEMGHARALLSLEGEIQSETGKLVAAKELTVRETETLVKKVQTGEQPKKEPLKDPETELLIKQLSEQLGAKVAITHNAKGKGKMVISYTSLDELDSIIAKIN